MPLIICLQIIGVLCTSFYQLFSLRVRSRVSNLGDEKNPDFIAMVLNGSVPAERVAKMSPEVGCGVSGGSLFSGGGGITPNNTVLFCQIYV